jgi:hypothetical protein
MNGLTEHEEDTETKVFWDEIWTLDDEWNPIPRQTRRPPAPRRLAMPVVEALGAVLVDR